MTQKKDRNPPSFSSSNTTHEVPEEEEENHTEKSRGWLWLLIFAVLFIAGGIWVIDKGYLDRLLSPVREPVMTTQTKPAPATEVAQDERENESAHNFSEPDPVYAQDDDISLLLANQVASKHEREQLQHDVARMKTEISVINKNMKILAESFERQREKPTAITVTTPAPDTNALQEMEKHIADLATRFNTLQQYYEQQNQSYGARLQVLQMLDRIAERATNGEPFMEDILRLRPYAAQLGMDGDVILSLQRNAEESAQPLSTLIQDYHELAQMALPSSLDSGQNVSVGDSIRRNLAHVVTIRKIEVEADDNTDEAHIARAEAELRAGNVEMALTHLEQLSEQPAAFFEKWQFQATRYLEIHGAIAQLKSALVQTSNGD